MGYSEKQHTCTDSIEVARKRQIKIDKDKEAFFKAGGKIKVVQTGTQGENKNPDYFALGANNTLKGGCYGRS